MSQTPAPEDDHGHAAPEPGGVVFNIILAASIAAFFGAGVYSAANAPAEVGEGHEGGEVAEAHHLREEAAGLAKEKHWAESLEKLAEAKKADPAGDKEEAVEHLRRIDEAELRGLPLHEPKGAPGAPEEKPEKGSDEAPHEGK